MRLARPLVAAIAVLATTCSLSTGTVSLAGDPGDKVGPAIRMLGEYDIHLSLEHVKAPECSDWLMGHKPEVLDTSADT